MRPLSKTDLRRSRPALHPPQPVHRTTTGAAEEALLFGESPRAIPPPAPLKQEATGDAVSQDIPPDPI